MSWIDAGAVEAIPRCGARVLRLAAATCRAVNSANVDSGRAEFGAMPASAPDDIAVFRTGDGRVFALRDRCPHRGGPLSQGIVHGTRVTCPLHDWVIDLASGAATGPDEGVTAVYDVRIENGRVWIRVGETPA